MSRLHWYPLLMLLLIPSSSRALQMHWASGATNLTFASATRCTLVVQVDSSEVRLPSEWRLLWVADSSSIHFVAADSLTACAAEAAQVSRLDASATLADSLANQITAHFCAASGPPPTLAYYILDQPGGSQGRLKVVALDPNDPDSSRVIESNEVSCNGGVVGSYPPAILRATRSHPSTTLRVSAVGAGLADAPRVEIAARDTSWRLALSVTGQSNSTLTAEAQVAADLPPFVLRVGEASPGEVGIAPLAADTASVLSVEPACVDFMREINLVTHEVIMPKDFAFVASRDSFHIFYIRHDTLLTRDATEKIIGHKRSRNLNDWEPTENTMTAIQARTGTDLWDNFHVWAPTIIRKPDDITYYMLYTGVQLDRFGNQIQRIGVATSTDLNIWTQDPTWIYEPKNTSWAEPDSSIAPGQQFRDPFVMADPDSAGHYLMFVVGGSKDRHPRMVVGVARTSGPVADFRKWYDVGALWNTDSLHSGAAFVESPHAFVDPGGRWSLYYTGYNLPAPKDSAFISFQANNNTPSRPIDPDTTMWTAPDSLYKALGGDQTVQFWHGSEYLNWGPGYEYLGAYNDSQLAIVISQIWWNSSHEYILTHFCPPVPAPLAADPKGGQLEFALNLQGRNPSRAPVGFAVETPTRARVRLAIYDVLGRRVSALLDEEVPPGRRELRWDGHGATGEAVGAGIYLARLTSVAGQRVVRVILLR